MADLATVAEPPLADITVTTDDRLLLAGLARGHTNTAIARTLHWTPGVVKYRSARLARRWECRRTSSLLVAAGYRTGVLRNLPVEPRPAVTLTTPQRLVLLGMAHGLTNAEIGALHYVGASTIGAEASRVLAALSADSRAHAVALGYQHHHLRTDTQ